MAFAIDITEPALVDIEDSVRFIREVKKEPEAAERWFRGLVQAIYSLEELPERCPVIPEQGEFSFEIRHPMAPDTGLVKVTFHKRFANGS